MFLKNKIKANVFAALFFAFCLFAFPAQDAAYATTAEQIYGKAECVVEANSRRVLYEWNGDTRLPMASTTKIVTAATVLERCKNLEEVVRIPKAAEGVEGSSVYLKADDTYMVEELLYGLMLRSGNDCAAALALHIGGTERKFCGLMNALAQKAGAFHSQFANPHGLPDDSHYTTARDLSLIACYAMQNPIFRRIVATKYYAPRHWKNKNKLLYEFDGAIGIKTGYTKAAGRCLVSAAERDGMTLVCTVLHCPPMYERSAQLLQDAFRTYRYTKLLTANEAISCNNADKSLQAYAAQDFYYPLSDGEIEQIERVTCVRKGAESAKSKEVIGKIQIYLAKRLLFSGNLYKL